MGRGVVEGSLLVGDLVEGFRGGVVEEVGDSGIEVLVVVGEGRRLSGVRDWGV